MYQNSALQRPEEHKDDRVRGHKMSDTPTHQPTPHQQPPSPSHPPYSSYSPKSEYRAFAPGQSKYHPSTPAPLSMASRSPHYELPPLIASNGISPVNGSASTAAPERPASTYYDPTSDHGDRKPSWAHGQYARTSPQQTQRAFNYARESSSEAPHYNGISQRTPTTGHFTHPTTTQTLSHSHPGGGSTSPISARMSVSSPLVERNSSTTHNGDASKPIASTGEVERSQTKPSRPSDPMAFSSILSDSTAEPPVSSTASFNQPTPAQPRKPSKSISAENTPKTEENLARGHLRRSSNRIVTPASEASGHLRAAAPTESARRRTPSKGRQSVSDKENEHTKAMAEIDALELSDVDAPGFETEKERFLQLNKKRVLSIEQEETKKRKRRRVAAASTLADQLGQYGKAGARRFRSKYEPEALMEVQHQEILNEKERKKDMQRKRRREKTIQSELMKTKEALEKAKQTDDQAEKLRLLKEAKKSEQKAWQTKNMLKGGNAGKEIREVTPLAPNLEGGTMGSFQMGVDSVPDPVKKKGRGGARPRKSKEQKQAEKDAAAAAHAAMESKELVAIAPKEESRRETLKKEAKERKATSPSPFTPYVSKGYNQIYDQIWRDLARKDIPRVYRIKETSLSTKQSNLRKTAQLASKEARRWQLRTNKSMKDVQARAKRSMREMMSFWKRNEKEERDLRRMAERQELENAKKAEADREANRQKRKLNFLISQTELYSHFIGRKIKTDEVERSTDDTTGTDVAVSKETVSAGKPEAHSVSLPDSLAEPGTKVTNFEDLDFDAEDETALREAAMANAQNAVQEAQDRARAFNQPADFDEGEMNFQNPTSLMGMDIAQPRMLTAQLKEYQLKGLNWLVNLYEQGINGILADEMGLGKTVQSISVMSYLAETHNIWGPFLVIAPASTLHNWQQEITKFVPDLKVLPYWGNAKDRKVLRKFWDRKHITYTQDSPFHVLVTSYQLVVQDSQYFQKIRWQYMILDEAQAIKSSQSSRWKSLLNFHCRNRLLLTGTPIQNNMQELWALLHFIMPSLFDSHDEFSDWFSKDIESHAQSNTKLNEDQLKRLHMILKPFMLRRIKKHVQKELGDKIEEDVFCDLTYRQRAYYANLRNRISIMDLLEKAAIGEDQDTATLMNLVMQFRKVCNHPDLFERAETTSPLSVAYFAETASFMREGYNVNVGYSTRNLIEYPLPRLVYANGGRLDLPGSDNDRAGFESKYLDSLLNIWTPENVQQNSVKDSAFSWLRFTDSSSGEVSAAFMTNLFDRAVGLTQKKSWLPRLDVVYDEEDQQKWTPQYALFNIVERNSKVDLATATEEGYLSTLMNVSRTTFKGSGLGTMEQCARPAASAPPVEISCPSQRTVIERENTFFNTSIRSLLYGPSEKDEHNLLERKIEPAFFPPNKMLPPPISEKTRFTNIQVPSMRRFVTDSGKLAKLDQLLTQLKEGGHRVLLYFQMTRMIDLMEEYLTYRNYKYLRLDGSTKLEDRRDTVHDFQTRPEIFVFLLSTRAGGLGINLTSADTVIFYDSDWNPTIDSQAMDRAHRLGQTKQVTVYRMITRGTIEERIRKRALQKEEVQRVVISGGAGGGVDFNTRSRENKAKDIAMWLADDDQAAELERKEAEYAAQEAKEPSGKKRMAKKRRADVSLDEMYHEGEGHFDDGSNKPSGAATPVEAGETSLKPKKGRGRGGISKRAKTAKERLAIADGDGGLGGL